MDIRRLGLSLACSTLSSNWSVVERGSFATGYKKVGYPAIPRSPEAATAEKKRGEAPLAPDGQNHYHALELALSPLDC